MIAHEKLGNMYTPLIETRHISSGPHRAVRLEREQLDEVCTPWNFSQDAFAGVISLPGDADSLLCWQLQNTSECSLQLAEVSLSGGAVGTAVVASIPGQAFPSVAHAIVNGRLCLYLLLSDQSVAVLQLPLGGGRHGPSLLDALQPGRVYAMGLAAQMVPVGAPTALAVVDRHLCLAGSSHMVACVPLTERGGLLPAQAHHLHTSNSLIQRLVGSFYTPSQKLGAAAALGVSLAGREVLLLVHEDASVRVWDVATQQQLLSEAVRAERSTADSWAPHGAVLATNGEDSAVVVADLALDDGSGRGLLVACEIALLPTGRPTLASRVVLELPSSHARLLGAKLAKGSLWVLVRADGQAAVLGFDPADGRFLGRVQMLPPPSSGWSWQDDLWQGTLGVFADAVSAEAHVLGQILVPGQLCRGALRDALATHGAHVGGEHLTGMSLNDLVAYTRAAVHTIASKNPTWPGARCWRVLFDTYREQWQLRHEAQALVVGRAGWLGVLRGGPLITTLRSSASVEQLPSCGGRSGMPEAWHLVVAECLQGVAQVLGQPAQQLFTKLAMAGVDILGKLLPGYVDLVLYGPLGASAASGATPAAPLSEQQRKRLSAWRQHRQQVLLQVQQLLGTLEDPLGAVGAFVQRLDAEAGSQLERTGTTAAPLMSGATATTLCSVALQVARANCVAAQQLLVLLATLLRLGAVGSAPLSAGQADLITGQLLPALAAHLQAYSMVLWLCKTPATVACSADGFEGADDDSSAHLAAIGASLRQRTRGAAPQQPLEAAAPRADDQPLARHLLRLFAATHPASAGAAAADAGRAGAALAAFIAVGPPRVASTGDSAASVGGMALPARALRVGYQLLASREFTQLAPLVALCGPQSESDAGLQFLSGVGLTLQMRALSSAGTAPGEAGARQLLSLATGHLFRAAAGLTAPDGAPLLQLLRRLQHVSDASDNEEAACQLEALSLSEGSGGTTRRAAEARLRLEFFERVMRLFDREACPEGALGFAYAALGELAAAYGAQECDSGASTPVERRRHEGRLWCTVFSCACDLSRWTAAYEAAAANPVHAQALACFQRLVHVLVEAHELGVLCSLPWAGALKRPLRGALLPDVGGALSSSGAAAMDVQDDNAAGAMDADGIRALQQAVPVAGPMEDVPVAEVVVEVLTLRAVSSDVGAPPSPYEALYGFLVVRGRFKEAAAVMLAYARRARAGVRTTLPHVVKSAYEVCIATLELLQPQDAWLDLQDNPVLCDLARSEGPVHDAPTEGASTGAPPASPPAQWFEWLSALDPLPKPPVVTLRAVRREAALFGALTVVAQHTGGWSGPVDEPGQDHVYYQLLALGLYDEAALLAHELWQGEALAEALRRLVSTLAAAAVRPHALGSGIDGGGGAGSSTGSSAVSAAPAALLQPGTYRGPGFLCSPSAGAWQRLRSVLDLYDSPLDGPYHGALRVAAAAALLRVDPQLEMPKWLLASLGSPPLPGVAGPGAKFPGSFAGSPADPSALLRLYLQHGRWQDAAGMVAEHLEAWSTSDPLTRGQGQRLWLPLQALEQLRQALVQAARQGGAASGVAVAAPALQRLEHAMAGASAVLESAT